MRRQYKPYGSDIMYHVVVIQEVAVVHTIITIIRIVVVTGPDMNVTLTLATDILDQVLVLLFLTNKLLNITFSIGKVFERILICQNRIHGSRCYSRNNIRKLRIDLFR